ncbi:acetate--CoA ligase family protein [Maridesulfovibrio bastinii]|uniref:acetate--CoA ligase family protein n=1 Tax=Maridesulfovibrio bastinii TaxID=47157 RepID=UPI0003F79141|nr:acetate--CoA ligase family protein [Maridesulfovibrio bastinii]
MEFSIDYEKISESLKQAEADGRNFLYEYETYTLLSDSGAESVPRSSFIIKGSRPSNEELCALPGEKAVLKIVSPTIFHKTELGGVRIVEKQPGKIRSTWRRMMDEVPENYYSLIESGALHCPDKYKGLNGQSLKDAISTDIKGVLLCEFMPPDSNAFGNELLVSLRCTREFGMVITAGLGGTDTELYAKRFRKGLAVVSASTELTNGKDFFRLFKKTIAYEKLSGATRGQQRIISDDQLIECFNSFIMMGNYFSPAGSKSEFILDELEVNPFAFTDYQMVPLDGICRFSRVREIPNSRPFNKISRLLQPESIAIIGASATRMNFGRIILNNVLGKGFPKEKVTLIKKGADMIDGVRCIPDTASLKKAVDLFIVAISAGQVPELANDLIDNKRANSVMLIPGGIGETRESEELAAKLKKRINEAHLDEDGGPVFVGANCLGIRSRSGRYDTIFIPPEKLGKKGSSTLGKRSAFISQSGAFLVTRVSKMSQIDPAYMISIGNQTDLTAGDFMEWCCKQDDLDVIAVYMEGFNDMDGLAFCRAVRKAVIAGKEVVFYKAGRTPEGRGATSGHTASVAGDYMVCESCVKQAGAMVADNFTQFMDLYLLANLFHGKKTYGNSFAAISGAGFEAVGMADNIQGDDFTMRMAEFSESTLERMNDLLKKARLDSLVTAKNPLDINPASNDRMHVEMASIAAADPDVDGIVLSLDAISPAVQSLPAGIRENDSIDSPESIANLMPEFVADCPKPVIAVVDAGRLYDELVQRLEDKGVAVFRSCDRAVSALGKYLDCRIYAENFRCRFC